MNSDIPPRIRTVEESYVWTSATLFRYIARVLRVSARHLPWEIAQKMHAQPGTHETEPSNVFPSIGDLQAVELEDYCWRVDVTRNNIDATKALGWHALHRLLLVAQIHRCEALELDRENPMLPAILEFEVFTWP